MPFASTTMSGSMSKRSYPSQVPEPSESADHAVDHQQHAVPLADRGDGLQVAGRRGANTAGADHGLAEERRHAVRADALDLVGQRLGRVVGDVRDRVDERAVALTQRLHREARPEAVRPVVGVGAADEMGALGEAPATLQYWRASLAAVSIASPPPRHRKTRESGVGESAARRSASSSAGGFARSPNVWYASSVRS